ncbi:uncharacterized protein Z520_03226 [Fonsecaea multimorphosa CBS 102226]|uniref:Uncharacterized protein n=1 Tax=Fonsecaea multimorphosa CBS 102226 TaxID=1442371 RepID=A0A0D2K410_9EURO|nr:uncharacterized protein Z520_03226 [Fonsecaea multimorphosa CBS 102226]KIY00563.1 hypothetical protein Z520_03226 [Fonsecaea multimorphosa CBS 102226]
MDTGRPSTLADFGYPPQHQVSGPALFKDDYSKLYFCQGCPLMRPKSGQYPALQCQLDPRFSRFFTTSKDLDPSTLSPYPVLGHEALSFFNVT